jgi:hypothetical protein
MPRRYRSTTRRQKRNVRKTRKAKATHRRQKKQQGGGMWESYCVACGKTLYPTNFKQLVDTNALTLNVNDIALPDTKWMGVNVGFDKEHNLVVLLGKDDFEGECRILKSTFQTPETNARLEELADEGLITTKFTNQNEYNNPEEEDKPSGYVLHHACLQVLAEAFNEVSFDFVEKLHAQGCGANDYQEQFYNVQTAVDENGVEHFESPLLNPVNRKAILDADCPIIQQKRAEELARRRRVVNAARAERAVAEKELPPGLSNSIKNFLRAPTNVRASNIIKNNVDKDE